MPLPCPCDALVDLLGLRDVLSADAILLVAPRHRRDLDVNHRCIAMELFFEIDTELLKEASP
jgi:hypothetical protein